MGQSSGCSKNTIITNLWNSRRINSLIKLKAPKGLEDDFKSEIFAILCEMPEDKLCELNDGGVWYTCRLILNMATKTGQFHYKYREKDLSGYQRQIESDELESFDIEYTKKVLSEIYPKPGESGLDELHRYKAEGREFEFSKIVLFREYIELRSCEAVAILHDVPKHYVQSVIRDLKERYRNVLRNGI